MRPNLSFDERKEALKKLKLDTKCMECGEKVAGLVIPNAKRRSLSRTEQEDLLKLLYNLIKFQVSYKEIARIDSVSLRTNSASSSTSQATTSRRRAMMKPTTSRSRKQKLTTTAV